MTEARGKMRKRIIGLTGWLLLAVFVLAACTGQAAERAKPEPSPKEGAEKTVFYDCSDDQMLYGKTVAALNRGETPQKSPDTPASVADSGEQAMPDFTAMTAILCRTEGQELDYSPWSPACVVAGPSNCYTLYFTDKASAEQACRELSEREGIQYAEPDGEAAAG